ncbi:site-specific integrase [Kitasatospora sp. NPDC088264]|uniref:site-specific integrase n=1 Tax=Kitasatospora sp. NPDC088264 TaxID=3155296 RepID=UPI0034179D57
MKAVLNGELRGVYEDRRVTVASFLRQWLAAQKEELAPNTYAGYEACVERDLIPAFGHYRLPDLRPKHIERWIAAQRKAKRGKVTIYRIVSTLRNALNHAVRSWGLRYNPAKHSVPPRPRAEERTCWTPDEAAAFLRHGAERYADRLTDLFEVMLGTGMRRSEVLALHWSDVHLVDRKLFVRWTLAAIDNGKIHLREPKTEASRAWISLSPRVMAALHRQAALQMSAHPDGRLDGLVFAKPDGLPLRPQWVLDQLRKRTAELDLPRIGLVSRPGARCRDCSRSVSPDRSPNPPCRSLGNGLSTVPAVRRGSQEAMGRGSCCPGRCSGRPSHPGSGSTRPRRPRSPIARRRRGVDGPVPSSSRDAPSACGRASTR